ncbi:MAG TPA: SGNH/GDSL hydrolase family protein [Chitinophagales bacterium]|nr:SGNH/GDSL hydrolase family protein [Chitinophagales bacterium]
MAKKDIKRLSGAALVLFIMASILFCLLFYFTKLPAHRQAGELARVLTSISSCRIYYPRLGIFIFALWWLVTISLAAIFLYAAFGLAMACLRALVHALATKVLPVLTLTTKKWFKHAKKWLKQNKYKFFITGFTVSIILYIVTTAETSYRRMGYTPGWLYPRLITVDVIDTSLQQHVVWPDGINSYKPMGLHYGRRCNAQGFIAGFNYDTATIARLKGKRKLLFAIGDSFTEGVSSGGTGESFMELLKADTTVSSKYLVCNFGVGGQNPFNYKLIAEKYVPLLKPDIVIINYCFNDDMYYKEVKHPFPNYYQVNFVTNGSSVSACKPDCSGFFTSARDAYKYYYKHYNIASFDWFGQLMSISVTTTLLYQKIEGIKPDPDNECDQDKGTIATSYYYLQDIKTVCRQNGAACKLFYIPAINEHYPTYKEKFTSTFKDLEDSVICPTDIEPVKDYISESNGHFNKEGNYKFYRLLKSYLLQ